MLTILSSRAINHPRAIPAACSALASIAGGRRPVVMDRNDRLEPAFSFQPLRHAISLISSILWEP